MAQFFRTGAPMGDWRSLAFTVDETAGLTHGQLFLLGDTVGMIFIGEPVLDANGCAQALVAALGVETTLIYHAEKIMLPKAAQVTFHEGDKIYWSGIHGAGVTTHASGLYWIGIAVAPAAAADTEVKADLLGNKATLLE